MAVFYPGRVLSDFNSGKYAPGYYWHAIDAGVPLSGQPNRFAYFDPRLGLSYDLFGTGNTMLRGGWGAYRFVTQVNDVSPPLVTAQDVLGYNSPGGKTIMLSQLGNLAYVPCLSKCVNGGQAGFDPGDYGQPLTYAYNFTIDQRIKWNTVLDIAYVGSQTSQLSDDSEGIEGSNFAALADQNKTPVGSFFKPDPVTGVLSTNPENLGQNPNGTGSTATGNVAADYHPYGYAYGTAAAAMIQSSAYSNYNALQVAWIKTTGKLGFNLNATWSKTLGTALADESVQCQPELWPDLDGQAIRLQRQLLLQHRETRYLTGVCQPAAGRMDNLGNLNMAVWRIHSRCAGERRAKLQSWPGVYRSAGKCEGQGIGSGIGSATYFGTDAALPILPVLTCNPTSNLGHYQRLNGKCFNAPAVGTQGGQNYPYMSAGAYFDNDLAIYRAFRIHESQQVQFRASAFNWLNHPIPGFSGSGGGSPLGIAYNVDYASKAITNNFNTATFGVQDSKTGAPFQRIITLSVKYFF